MEMDQLQTDKMYLTIPDSLSRYSYDETVVVKSLNPNTYYYGLIDLNTRYTDFNSISQYESRYGVPFVNKGTIVGERFSSQVLADLKNHPDNPLDLDPSFDPYGFEANSDCKILKDAWDRFIGPLHDSLFSVEVPPVEPPDPVDPPIVDPPVIEPPEEPPTPVPTPIKVYPEVPSSFFRWLRLGESKILIGASYKNKLKQIREWLEAYELFRKS